MNASQAVVVHGESKARLTAFAVFLSLTAAMVVESLWQLSVAEGWAATLHALARLCFSLLAPWVGHAVWLRGWSAHDGPSGRGDRSALIFRSPARRFHFVRAPGQLSRPTSPA